MAATQVPPPAPGLAARLRQAVRLAANEP
jgi:hypothetical protein